MTVAEPMDSGNTSDYLICPQCSTLLPVHALFCSACGGRIKQSENSQPLRVEAPLSGELRTPSLPASDTPLKERSVTEKPKASMMIFDKRTILHPVQSARSLVHRFHSDSLARNSIYIMATTIATGVIGYLYWTVATHIYSAHDVGLASALLS